MPDGWADLAQRAGADVYRFEPPERIPQWLMHRGGALSTATRAFIHATLGAVVQDPPG
jgi:hypothetical protein